MIRIQYLTEEGINDIHLNEEKYEKLFAEKTNVKLLEELRKNNFLADSNIECEEFNLDLTPYTKDVRGKENYEISDYKNVEIINKVLGDKIPLPAALDIKIWAGISIIYCWDYIRFRKEKDFKSGKDKKLREQFILERNGKKRRVFIQALSRLYWAGKVLYDEENETDKLWVISELFKDSFASAVMLLSSYNILNNKDICLGIMEALKYFKDREHKLAREHYIAAYKHIDHIGATMLLDCYTRAEIKEIVVKYLGENYFN